MTSPTINKTVSQEDHENLKRIVHPRIIGGINTLDNELPFMAYIQVCNQPETICSLCGGAVIHRNFIVTAGHCKEDHQHHFNIRLNYQGYRDRIYIEYSIEIDKFIRHPYYNHKTVDHDIGLIQIPGTHGIPDVRMAQLPLGRPYTNDVLTVAGWGVTDYTKNTFPEVLQRLDVPVIDDDLCYNWLKITKEITFCAGFEEGGKDACQGDSGGALVWKSPETEIWGQLGIVSYGIGCGQPDYPGIYTKVSAYISWIERTLNYQDMKALQEQNLKNQKLISDLIASKKTDGNNQSKTNFVSKPSKTPMKPSPAKGANNYVLKKDYDKQVEIVTKQLNSINTKTKELYKVKQNYQKTLNRMKKFNVSLDKSETRRQNITNRREEGEQGKEDLER